MSGWLPKFVTPHDVRAYRERLAPYVLALDASVARCPGLDPDTRRAWVAFSRAWKAFEAEEPSWLHAAAQYDEAERYEDNLRRWEGFIDHQCAVAGPGLGQAPQAGATVASTIKTVAVAGAVVAVLLFLRSESR